MRAAAREFLRGLLVAALVAGCGPPTKEELLSRARGVSTRAELERALGKPSDIRKLGPVEQWTYEARNGTVVFVIVGDRVAIEAAGGEGDKR